MKDVSCEDCECQHAIAKLFAASFLGRLAGRADLNIECPSDCQSKAHFSQIIHVYVRLVDIVNCISDELDTWKGSEE